MIEKKMIALIQKGDPAAFRSLLDQYEHRVYHFVKKLTNDPHLAEDVTQETFLAVYRSMGTFDPTKAFSTWLFTIAKHQAFKMMKSRKAPAGNLPIEDLQLEDKGMDVLGQVIQSEAKVELLMAIDQLKTAYKDVIILRYFYDCSYQEISHALGIPTKKVENRLRAGKQKLQVMLMNEKGLVACYDY